MAEADFGILTGSLSSPSIATGVSGGFTPPAGGGSFIYGINSLVNVVGVYGLYCGLANFAPMAKGGRVSAVLKRGISGGPTKFSPWLFVCAGGNATTDNAYMLGLGDGDPSHIVLRKGSMAIGLIDDASGSNGVLARSTDTIDLDEWIQLQLEVVVNVSGDVVLNVRQNDLTAHNADAPVWAPVTGMRDFVGGVAQTAMIDDALGVNTGSLPYSSGYIGFAGRVADISRRMYWDQLVIERQT